MKRYTNKWVEFLNGANTIEINCVKDFNSINALCKRVGLDFISDNYWNLLRLAEINDCRIGFGTILVEYQPGKGFSMGYRTIEDSEKWYELRPFKVKEIIAELKGE